jgi:uncharacterized membrane protein
MALRLMEVIVDVDRISREELYNSIADGAKLSRVFVMMVILSAIVAAIGLIKDNVAVVVGAMVIAPLLGPNVALALGTTLGDIPLTLRSLKTNVVGVAIAFARERGGRKRRQSGPPAGRSHCGYS